MQQKKQDCLVIKNDGIGDLVLASGIIARLAERFDGNLDLVTCEQNREVAARIPGVRNIITISRDGLRLGRGLGRLGIYREIRPATDRPVLKQLRGTRYDTAICLRRYIRTSSLILMGEVNARWKHCCWEMATNAPERFAIGKSKNWHHYSGDPSILPELTHYKRFAKECFDLDGDLNPVLHLNTIVEQDDTAAKVISLIIGGASTNWPAASWLELARVLSVRGYRLRLFGGPGESLLASEIAKVAVDCENMVGRLSLMEAEAQISSSGLVIANDTGLTHLASLRSRRVLIIMGGGTFPRFLPWPDSTNQYLILRPLECYGCTWTCDYSERYCLHFIPVGDVADYGEEIIASAGKVSRWRMIRSEARSFNALRSFSQLPPQQVEFSGFGSE
jgi:ADP-heptose:LPS heptosyltransferase